LVELKWVNEGVEKFGRYFGRKGWFGFSREDVGDIVNEQAAVTEEGIEGGAGTKRWYAGDSGKRILMEVATAYAITKVLLPLRVVISVWATPWFARNVLGRVGRFFKWRGGQALAAAGAVGGGVVGKRAVKKGP